LNELLGRSLTINGLANQRTSQTAQDEAGQKRESIDVRDRSASGKSSQSEPSDLFFPRAFDRPRSELKPSLLLSADLRLEDGLGSDICLLLIHARGNLH